MTGLQVVCSVIYMDTNGSQRPVSPFVKPAGASDAETRKAAAKWRKTPEGIAFELALQIYADAQRAQVQSEITPEQRAQADAQEAAEQARYNRCRRAGRGFYMVNN